MFVLEGLISVPVLFEVEQIVECVYHHCEDETQPRHVVWNNSC